MKRIYLSNRYGSGYGPTHDMNYDYLLFKQTWDGQESIFFNKEELDVICDKIDTGEIIIDIKDSLLYCKNQSRLDEIKNKFRCYECLIPQNS